MAWPLPTNRGRDQTAPRSPVRVFGRGSLNRSTHGGSGSPLQSARGWPTGKEGRDNGAVAIEIGTNCRFALCAVRQARPFEEQKRDKVQVATPSISNGSVASCENGDKGTRRT